MPILQSDSNCPNNCEESKIVTSNNGLSGTVFLQPCCEPDCEGKSCGEDGCGGSCGDCPPDFACSRGSCIEVGDICNLSIEGSQVNSDFQIAFPNATSSETISFGFNPLGVQDQVIVEVNGVEVYSWCGSWATSFSVSILPGDSLVLRVLANCDGAVQDTVWGLVSTCSSCRCISFIDPFISGGSNLPVVCNGNNCDGFNTGDQFLREYHICTNGEGNITRDIPGCGDNSTAGTFEETRPWGPNCQDIVYTRVEIEECGTECTIATEADDCPACPNEGESPCCASGICSCCTSGSGGGGDPGGG